jgi:hypothetical protein
MAISRQRRRGVGIVLLALAACGPPPEANDQPPERLRALERPDLSPTADFDAALQGARPDAARLTEANAALAARASALEARAAALAGEVIDPATRPRLGRGGSAQEAD